MGTVPIENRKVLVHELASPTTPGPVPTQRPNRREVMRARTSDEIKEAARGLLRLGPATQLSMRAVARQVGMTPSGLYRYFDGHQHLVSALVGDAYADAGDAIAAAAPPEDVAAQAHAMAHAYREWGGNHREEFALMFSTDPQITGDLAVLLDPGQINRFFAAPIANYAAGLACGDVVLDAPPDAAPQLAPMVDDLRLRSDSPLRSHQLGALLSGWACLHGFISLELFGPLGWFYADPDEAWAHHVRGVLRTLGYQGV